MNIRSIEIEMEMESREEYNALVDKFQKKEPLEICGSNYFMKEAHVNHEPSTMRHTEPNGYIQVVKMKLVKVVTDDINDG